MAKKKPLQEEQLVLQYKSPEATALDTFTDLRVQVRLAQLDLMEAGYHDLDMRHQLLDFEETLGTAIIDLGDAEFENSKEDFE